MPAVKTQARGVRARHEILALIRVRSGHGTTPPTIREIAAAVGLSTATVHRHVGILVATGLLEHTPNQARTLRPVQPVRGSRS